MVLGVAKVSADRKTTTRLMENLFLPEAQYGHTTTPSPRFV